MTVRRKLASKVSDRVSAAPPDERIGGAPDIRAADRGPATMRDVAALAGVSISTISHVLNGTRAVPATTRARVAQAIETTGYTPNSVARSLKRAETRTIGIAIGDITNPHFTAVVDAIEAAARAQGYTVILVGISESAEREIEGLDALLGRRVDGLILAPSADGGSTVLDRVRRHNIPVVQIDRVASASCDAVVVANADGARRLMRHVAACGHRRIGMLTGLPGLSSTRERINGYRAGLRDAGIAYDAALLACGDYSAEPARRATTALLALPNPPTAIFASNNLMTLGAMQALADHKLSVPDDIALVAFDDFAWTDLFKPHLTTVAQPCRDIGVTAVRLLLERLAEPGLKPRLVRLPVELRLRESCGCGVGAREIA
ncbi:LacI family DNA-binding transcriptional regulator [Acidiphilium acidophilum]|uniref:LacI family DNA-binding transcriptional regulator n=1 Tax=Acidiphilium acidophilum TaxID=76588 RepID=A0AAW9DWF4_ACIAO|nr:LacI family DNA-binding transcriptional regulator [Acidiphilium acidophilum]MDX5932942.1 LacI family DNA-binding transcriptional regulator [Acidiphilium acidophilum]